jgi:hypothetical protein
LSCLLAGQLCVHLAAAGDHADVLRHLVWAGANINGRVSRAQTFDNLRSVITMLLKSVRRSLFLRQRVLFLSLKDCEPNYQSYSTCLGSKVHFLYLVISLRARSTFFPLNTNTLKIDSDEIFLKICLQSRHGCLTNHFRVPAGIQMWSYRVTYGGGTQ